MSSDAPSTTPPTIDPVAAQRWARLRSDASPWLHEEVARRMAERLQWIRLQPAAWLDWAPLRGGLLGHGLVTQKYPKSQCYVQEASVEWSSVAIKNIASPWWSAGRWMRSQPRAGLPPDASADMVWANMALHTADDPQGLMRQWHRALAPQGFLMFSCLGPDTLRELHALYARLDWPPPAHACTDMHDWGDMLAGVGYAEPVMDMERISLSFETPERLLNELRELGRNLHPARFAALRGKAWRAQLCEALQAELGQPLVLSFEVIYGHAIKPTPRAKVSELSAVSLQDMRAMLHAGKP